MPSRIQIGKVVTVKGRRFKIGRSKAKNKKYVARPLSKTGRSHNFGQKGATARPGTPKGDSYCARSAKIRSKNPSRPSANDFSRMLWNCNGAKSRRR